MEYIFDDKSILNLFIALTQRFDEIYAKKSDIQSVNNTLTSLENKINNEGISSTVTNIIINGEQGKLDNGNLVIDVPTKVSQLTNDVGYQTSSQVTQIVNSNKITSLSQLTNDAGYQTADDVARIATAAVTAKVPTRLSQLRNDVGYVTASQLGSGNINTGGNTGTGNVNVPVSSITKVSQLENDMNYQTAAQVDNKISIIDAKITSLTNTVTSNTSKISKIPTKTSQLTNDSGFQTATQVNSIVENSIGTVVTQSIGATY